MSRTYQVQVGDTFERIARRVYGTDSVAARISDSNPGAATPPVPGTLLLLPNLEDPSAFSPSSPLRENQITVIISGQQFDAWERATLELRVDTVRSVTLFAPFDPALAETRELLRPFAFQEISVFLGNDLFLTGTVVSIIPTLREAENFIEIAAYGRPGVLGNCTPPASLYPKLEFSNQGLRTIAETLAAPFAIPVDFETDEGPTFTQNACRPDQTVFSYLAELGRQRNIVFSDTPAGRLVGREMPRVSTAAARFEQGSAAVVEWAPQFTPERYFSHLTAISPVDVGTQGAQFTVANPHLPAPLRPVAFIVGDAGDAQAQVAAASKMGRMFGNMAQYGLTLPQWRSPAGDIWAPGDTVTLNAPGVMIYSDYDFLIAAVSLTQTADTEVAHITCVLPGSFRGEIPEALPWED